MIPQLVVLSSKDKRDKYIIDLTAFLSLSSYDVFKISPENEKTGLGIDQIRTLSEVILTEATSQRIVVLYSFETSSLEAQNALLKILEEKTLQNIFILFVSNIERIIPTIRSRVQVVILDERKKNLDKNTMSNMQNVYKLLKNPKSFSFLRLDDYSLKTREDTVLFIDDFIIFLRIYLKEKDAAQISSMIKKALQVKNNILAFNANHQISLDSLLLFFHKTVRMKART